MLVARDCVAPQVDERATVAASASVVGNVRIGAGAYVDHGVVIESSGDQAELHAQVMATLLEEVHSWRDG